MTQKRSIPSFRLSLQPPELDRVLDEMKSVLMSGQYTLGKHGKALEAEFARFVGVPYACAVNSGTSALEIPLRVFGVQGKEVLVPTNTFFATPAAVVHAGGIPRFVDCDPATLITERRHLEAAWNPNVAGVIIVHIGGVVAPGIKAVQAFCKEKGIFLLEDAAHAHGSAQHGAQAGTFGDAAAFSFYPTKVMTSGEGGILVTSDKRMLEEAQGYRDQGKESFTSNFHARMGYNWRMSEFHAVIGRSQLRELPGNIAKRREVARWYDAALRGQPELQIQSIPLGGESNYYKYPVLLPLGLSRPELKRRIRAEFGVGLSGEVYETPCHKQPVFQRWSAGFYPGAEAACARQICLPLYPGVTRDVVAYVTESLVKTLEGLKTGVGS